MATYVIRPTLEKNELSQHHNRKRMSQVANTEMYFEKRAFLQSLNKTLGHTQTILKQQEGRCPVCKQMLDGTPADFHLHHIIPIARGGSDRIENLVFLHPMCHQQLHWQSAKEAAFSNENDTEGLSRVRRKSHARF
jgi:5-methylcytosine-specific restriction endonuclease McrA